MRVGFVRATLHLGGLWALAFAQPLLGLLGRQAEFFVARGSTRSDILLLALGYGLVPPVVAGAAVALAGRLRPALGRDLLLGLVALLVAALVLPPAGRALGGSGLAVALALAVGALAAAAYARAEAARTLLSALSPAPLVVLVLFLVVSPVSQLLRASPASGAVAGPARSSTPIVHVVLDELPVTTLEDGRGRIDARRFPHLAAFARTATWYRNATTTADSTLEAVPLQLTGVPPHEGQLPTAADHPDSLFTLFAASHDLIVDEPITDVCPQRLCAEATEPAGRRLRALAGDLGVVVRRQLLPARLVRGLPAVDGTWSGFATPDEPPVSAAEAERRRSALGRQVGRSLGRSDVAVALGRVEQALRRPRSRPPLVFFHATLPHAPWRFLPDGRRYALHPRDPPGLLDKGWEPRQWLVDQAFQRHVLQTEYVDRLLGELLRAVRAAGVWDRAVIVVTADHGASFTAGHGRRSVTERNAPEIAGVPFLVKLPGQRAGRVDDRAVRTIDVLPTIAPPPPASTCPGGSAAARPAGARSTRPPASTSPTPAPRPWRRGCRPSWPPSAAAPPPRPGSCATASGASGRGRTCSGARRRPGATSPHRAGSRAAPRSARPCWRARWRACRRTRCSPSRWTGGSPPRRAPSHATAGCATRRSSRRGRSGPARTPSGWCACPLAARRRVEPCPAAASTSGRPSPSAWASARSPSSSRRCSCTRWPTWPPSPRSASSTSSPCCSCRRSGAGGWGS